MLTPVQCPYGKALFCYAYFCLNRLKDSIIILTFPSDALMPLIVQLDSIGRLVEGCNRVWRWPACSTTAWTRWRLCTWCQYSPERRKLPCEDHRWVPKWGNKSPRVCHESLDVFASRESVELLGAMTKAASRSFYQTRTTRFQWKGIPLGII